MASITTSITGSPKRLTAIDEVSTNLTYIGFAKLGTLDSSSHWQIFRIQKTGTQTYIQYANGNDEFSNVWNDRATLTYTN